METSLAGIVLLFGVVIVLSLLGKSLLARLGLPALVAYIPLGILLRSASERWGLPGESLEIFAFLGELGVAVLLFRVGFETDLAGLRKQLRRASVVWIVSMLVSGAAGYATAAWLLGLGLLPSLFVATALTATSVGVSMAVWQEAGRLRSELGELLVDVAELDDISAVVLMGVLLAVAPLARDGGLEAALPVVAITAGGFLLKAVAFAGACFLFARYAEAPVARFLHRVEAPHDAVLSIIAVGLIIASAAAFLGFSIAVGAFLAGLMFRGEESAFRQEGGFDALYGMFVPFFFVGIGLMVTPEALTASVGVTLALLAAAVLGKVVGAGLPAHWLYGRSAGAVIGVSMVPRAEIGLIVMQQGQALGPWAVPPELFTAMVGVAALTSVGAPFVIRRLLGTASAERRA